MSDKIDNRFVVVFYNGIFYSIFDTIIDYTSIIPEWNNDDLRRFLWEEGNFSCDCNRSEFFGIEQLPCGDSIKLVQLGYNLYKWY